MVVKAAITTMKKIKTAFQSDDLDLDLNVTLTSINLEATL
jgi:hypothetical protein